ncbi:MAG: gliding motility-associated C-terminal domain-containing protein, partial [Phycisphaeraceae bacterium]|nr:gliding motility-associated C-terminal domain-containing protein [Phycisphaeraceae bacterium]
NFGGGPRSGAVGFAIGSKGYLGTGNLQNDFWEYDPTINAWTQIASFMGPAREIACGFSVGGRGFVGTGSGYSPPSFLQDFWKYDPASNTWTQLANFLGGQRQDVDRAPFVIGSKAYVGTGLDKWNNWNVDFWEYDPTTDSWSQNATLPAAPRCGATGFSICNKGFLGLGSGSILFNDLWMYDPLTNSWSAASSLPSLGRADQPSFVINNKAYIGTGIYINTPLKDLWEFTLDTDAILSASNTTICQGQMTTITSSSGLNYIWSPGGQTTPSIIVSPSISTTYSVIVTGLCSQDTASIAVQINPDVNASFTIQYVLDTCSSTISMNFIDNSTNASKWQWDIYSDGMIDFADQNPLSTFSLPVNFSVTLIASNAFGCSDTAQQLVNIKNSITPAIYIPNAFSPNNDNDNDILFVQGAKCLRNFLLVIYNKWGEKVFETTSPTIGWDGTLEGQKENIGVYTYHFDGTLASGKRVQKKGNITLVR